MLENKIKMSRQRKISIVLAHIFDKAPTFDQRKSINELYDSLSDKIKNDLTRSTHRLIITSNIIRDRCTSIELNINFQLEHNPRSNSLNKQFMLWKDK